MGPLEVTADSTAVEIGGARVRALLVRLAVAAGRVVTTEELADALWPDDKPADAVDALRFDRLAREIRIALAGGDPMTARRLAADAVALWRGPALVDAAGNLRMPLTSLVGRSADVERVAGQLGRCSACSSTTPRGRWRRSTGCRTCPIRGRGRCCGWCAARSGRTTATCGARVTTSPPRSPVCGRWVTGSRCPRR
ncbi:hypothetical protein ALI22I_24620 [Saccharothrix sp. ALI-22-I]|nr:hypothetical protein ALI22I_24620 [Saccharothrix sp. ALI-22-I]